MDGLSAQLPPFSACKCLCNSKKLYFYLKGWTDYIRAALVSKFEGLPDCYAMLFIHRLASFWSTGAYVSCNCRPHRLFNFLLIDRCSGHDGVLRNHGVLERRQTRSTRFDWRKR